MTVRPVLLAVIALTAGIALTTAAAADPAKDAASAVVQQTLDGVVAVLRNRDLPDDVRRTKVEAIAYARFDFDTISRLVLARNWKELSPEQRDQFIVEFKRHLTSSYWRTLDDYRDEDVKLTGSRSAPNGDVTVRSRILGTDRAAPILIDYRMRTHGGDWRVIDVIIESVSLVQNFRSQTQEIISDVGVDQLIQRLHEKNEQSG
jgi:phospholipid transport system substrate-binding protein